MPSAPSLPTIAGYRPIQLLSRSGGYGDVYLYEEERLHRQVAVKVLREKQLDAAAQERFENEAHTMAALEHPNIVRIYGAGATDEGQPFLSMMYCPKPTLAERVAREGRLIVQDALRVGVDVSGAVASAHHAGVLHRDIKPANILTLPWDAPGLTDFGVAAHITEFDEEDEDVGVSIPWSPPEMLFSKTKGSVATDVYSLAATMWHLLVGRSPFEIRGGDNTRGAIMSRIRDSPAPATGVPEVPEALERALARGLAKDPTVRHPSVADFGQALSEVAHQMGLPLTPMIVLQPRRPPGPGPSGPSGSARLVDWRTVHRDRPAPASGAPTVASRRGISTSTNRRKVRQPVRPPAQPAIRTDPDAARLSRSSSDPRLAAGRSSAREMESTDLHATGARAGGGPATGHGASRGALIGILVLVALLAAAVAIAVPLISGNGADPQPSPTLSNSSTSGRVDLDPSAPPAS